ncbi:MAG: carbamate kinase [Candidatus Nanopelagicales bacterium]
MRIVVALGGNALARRGEPMTVERQRANVATACTALAPVAEHHELVISHGNGPQVGMLALQSAAYDTQTAYPFDVMGAQTEGMIGYFIEQELGNLLPMEKSLATLLTMVEVDPEDPAFQEPSKFVGPVYDEAIAKQLAADNGWTVKPDGGSWRRVVPSPQPRRIFELNPIKWLISNGAVVVCAGGGGIPTMYEPGTRNLVGVEAVIDKDLASYVLARDLDADLLVIATDTPSVFLDWGTDNQRAVTKANPDALVELGFAAGSMGPKVEAAAAFAKETGKTAAIGSLDQLEDLIEGKAGTHISTATKGIESD